MMRGVVHTVLLAGLVVAACGLGENPHERRGDDYFRAGRYEDAFAEYSVAYRQVGEDVDLLRKMGRTSVMRKDLKGAREAYTALLRLSPGEADRVALDFFRLGIDFHEAGDDVQMAGAFESLFAVDSTYNIGEYYYYLADHYYRVADFGAAVAFYARALSHHPDHPRAGEATYRLALSNEKIGNCRDALVYYEQFLRSFPGSDEAETAGWHRGSCAYAVAEEEMERGNLVEALEYVRIPISTGQPPVKLDDAWFLRGEIYRELGRADSALFAYGKVLELNPARSGRLVSIARQRINEIRFGR